MKLKNFRKDYERYLNLDRMVNLVGEMINGIEMNVILAIINELNQSIEGSFEGEILEKVTNVSYQKVANLSTPTPLSRELIRRAMRENRVIDNLDSETEKKKEVEIIHIEVNEDRVLL